jgi:hypothetical protein
LIQDVNKDFRDSGFNQDALLIFEALHQHPVMLQKAQKEKLGDKCRIEEAERGDHHL